MKITLECPHAHYDQNMRIRCTVADDRLCAHQYFKACKGWWALTDQAKDCPMRGGLKDAGETDQVNSDQL